MKTVTVVVSVYNEEQALPKFYEAVKPILEQDPWDYELLFVNDGSQDGSLEILRRLAAADSRVKVVSFSRNFGHEAAMIAGLDYSSGDMVICMDADLQHPPECIPKILRAAEEGYDVVSMVRTRNQSAGFLKGITSAAFNRVINALSDVQFEANASDFFGVSRRAVEVLKQSYREKVRFLRGYVQNLGFRRTRLEYEAGVRVAGESKYSIRKLFSFAVNTILCFSNLPLRLGIYAGIFTGALGFLVMVYTIWTWVRVGTPDGYATIVVLICFMFAVLFLMVGIIGEYIAILFAELKDRPIYIVEGTENMEATEKERNASDFPGGHISPAHGGMPAGAAAPAVGERGKEE